MEALRNLKFEKDHDGTIDEASTTEAEDSAVEPDPELEAEIAAIEREIDGDYIDEEMLVFADFETHLAADELTNPDIRIKVIGIDSDNPVIQINDDIYRGSYDFAMGTNIFLEEDPEAKSKIDPLYSLDPPKMYKYGGQSQKVLKMKRIFATPKADVATIKTEPEADLLEETKTTMDERYLVTRSYEEALNLHLPFGCFPPRFIEGEQNGEKVVHRKATALTRVDNDMEDDAAARDDPRDVDYRPGMET